MSTTTAQLQHLWAASHALAATSPAVSAHLMTRLLNHSHEKEINLGETVSRQVCTACGTVAIPGVNSHVHFHRRKRNCSKQSRKRLRLSGGDREIQDDEKGKNKKKISKLQMVYECQACGRSRTQDVSSRSKPSSRARSKRLATTEVPSAAAAAEAQPSPAPALSQNAGSKRRAKSRKGNSLSDILAAKRKQESLSGARGNGVGGFGLDLMDLMKTG